MFNHFSATGTIATLHVLISRDWYLVYMYIYIYKPNPSLFSIECGNYWRHTHTVGSLSLCMYYKQQASRKALILSLLVMHGRCWTNVWPDSLTSSILNCRRQSLDCILFSWFVIWFQVHRSQSFRENEALLVFRNGWVELYCWKQKLTNSASQKKTVYWTGWLVYWLFSEVNNTIMELNWRKKGVKKGKSKE